MSGRPSRRPHGECSCPACALRAKRILAGLTQPQAARQLVRAGLSRDGSGRRLRAWEAGGFARLAPAVQAAVLAALKGDAA